MKVNKSEMSSGSFETYLFEMMKFMVDLISDDM